MTLYSTTVRAGLVAGIGTASWTMFEYLMGWHGERMDIGAITGFVGLIFPVGAILWALRTTKRESGGRLSIRQALICGLSVSLILAAVGIAFYLLYYGVINPGFIARLRASGVETSTASQLITVAGGSLVMGMLIALLGGLAMRTPDDAARGGS